MKDRLDELLTHLPQEAPAPDLAARIISAVAWRQRARTMRRRASGVVLACGFAGIVLVTLSWPEVTEAFATASTAPDANALSLVLDNIITSPLETLTGLLNRALEWETTLADSVSLVLMLGITLLAVAAFGGLVQQLRLTAPLNGNSH
jgi:hypothetical protein